MVVGLLDRGVLADLAGDLEAGNTLYFLVVQECEKGVHRWIEIPAAGKPASEYPDVIDSCIAANEDGCNEALRAELPAHIAASRTAINYVHRLPFKSLITTNFDPWIRQLSTKRKYEGVHIYPTLPLGQGVKGRIYYIHGYFDSEDQTSSVSHLVLGRQSINEAYSDSLLPGFLLNLFVYENVLFIGFNPLEEHIKELLRRSVYLRLQVAKSLGIAPTSLPKRFILYPAPVTSPPAEAARERAVLNEFTALEITPVFFDKAASDYSGIEQVLSNWVEEGDLKERSAPFDTGFNF
jgi:hypothetical protein